MAAVTNRNGMRTSYRYPVQHSVGTGAWSGCCRPNHHITAAAVRDTETWPAIRIDCHATIAGQMEQGLIASEIELAGNDIQVILKVDSSCVNHLNYRWYNV